MAVGVQCFSGFCADGRGVEGRRGWVLGCCDGCSGRVVGFGDGGWGWKWRYGAGVGESGGSRSTVD